MRRKYRVKWSNWWKKKFVILFAFVLGIDRTNSPSSSSYSSSLFSLLLSRLLSIALAVCLSLNFSISISRLTFTHQTQIKNNLPFFSLAICLCFCFVLFFDRENIEMNWARARVFRILFGLFVDFLLVCACAMRVWAVCRFSFSFSKSVNAFFWLISFDKSAFFEKCDRVFSSFCSVARVKLYLSFRLISEWYFLVFFSFDFLFRVCCNSFGELLS